MAGASSPPVLMAFSPLSSLPSFTSLSATAQVKSINLTESCSGCTHALFSGQIVAQRFLSFQSRKTIKLEKLKQGRVLVASDSSDPSSNSGITDVTEASDNNDVGSIPLIESNSREEAKAKPSDAQSLPRKSLTAREKLRAARVLSKYNESKPSKSEMGTSILDALKENDKGKRRSRLPEAPSNLFDDSKRGLPKQGLTFNFPGGNDLLQIAVSFVLISSIMLGTTYILWKVGAIHFNEY